MTAVSDYHPQELDKKWQQRWARRRAFEVTEDPSRPKFYCLEMFAYPSGHAHVGHVRNYIIGDIVARVKRMQGFNVLHPFGWDAFGLPAENAAIKNGIHPETWTLDNIAHMKGQLQRLGISYAWEREIATCLPDTTSWNQWLFLRMFERGLAYRRRSTVNWCPSCQTVLANEQVVDGGCWRCGTPVEQRELEQWFFRITAYADELLDAPTGLPQWPEKVLTMQRNWIGRSEGARVRFPLRGRRPATRDRGLHHPHRHHLGATFVLLAPEHPLVAAVRRANRDDPARVSRRRSRGSARRIAPARVTGEVEKEGFFTGRYAHQSVHRRAGADLGGELRARRVRHRRRDGRAGARSARLRVRPQVRAADPRGRRSRADGDAASTSATMTERGRRTTACWSTRASWTACRPTRRGGS